MRQKVKKLFDNLPIKNSSNFYHRTLTAIFLFDFLDRLRMGGFPSDWFPRLKKELSLLVAGFDIFEFSQNKFGKEWKNIEANKNFEFKTGEVYFNLWKNFSKAEYFKQTTENLKERFKKNDIKVRGFREVLDDGCGGGRYTLALKKLGCKKVVGIDISGNSIDLAKRMNPYKKSEVSFVQGSVLDLPFEDNSFDFVFSNGVLHHTTSTKKGLEEIYRVLKPGAKCWLYLYGGKETLFWDIVDFCRELLKDVPQHYTQVLMRVLGYPPGRIFHRTDFFYVPVNNRYFESEVVPMLRNAGFSGWRRLKRGVSFDRDEIIFKNKNIDPYIYGEGEMKFLISK